MGSRVCLREQKLAWRQPQALLRMGNARHRVPVAGSIVLTKGVLWCGAGGWVGGWVERTGKGVVVVDMC